MATIARTASGTWKAVVRRQGWPQAIKTFRLKRDAEDWARGVEDEDVRPGAQHLVEGPLGDLEGAVDDQALLGGEGRLPADHLAQLGLGGEREGCQHGAEHLGLGEMSVVIDVTPRSTLAVARSGGPSMCRSAPTCRLSRTVTQTSTQARACTSAPTPSGSAAFRALRLRQVARPMPVPA